MSNLVEKIKGLRDKIEEECFLPDSTYHKVGEDISYYKNGSDFFIFRKKLDIGREARVQYSEPFFRESSGHISLEIPLDLYDEFKLRDFLESFEEDLDLSKTEGQREQRKKELLREREQIDKELGELEEE